MFGFNKKQELITGMLGEPKEIVVSVPDIKEYLIREYDRSKELAKTIECKDGEIDKYKEMELKYKATLVTLDEYSNRNRSSEWSIKKKEDTIAQKDEKIKLLQDQVNGYNLKTLSLEDMRNQIATEERNKTIDAVIDRVAGIKGNLTKRQVTELLEGYKQNWFLR